MFYPTERWCEFCLYSGEVDDTAYVDCNNSDSIFVGRKVLWNRTCPFFYPRKPNQPREKH
jgi:hypothetical protein